MLLPLGLHGHDVAYDFSSLSPADFEDLSRDLLGKELNLRFEAFAAGPDGGIDGRHAKGGKTTILQAKRYVGSRFSDLKRVMKTERSAIDRLQPQRYLLSTAFDLTDKNKKALAVEIGPWLREPGDILGAADLNGLLRTHPDVLKSHFKLWLSSTAVLEQVLRAASHEHTSMTRREIEDKVRVYAPNPSFDEARLTLAAHHVLIVAGPPGVGKTTLAEMLVFAHLAEDWDLVPIRSLDDGLAEISDLKKQIFYFDDFLGRIELDKKSLARTDSDLARFIKRVRKSPNARFVLTTRAPIFEEARLLSEHLNDKSLDITKYLLDVGKYTRRIKTRILYNHLHLTDLPAGHVNALIESGRLLNIVDHPNYNPRLIAMMTQPEHVDGVSAEDYTDHFVSRLDKPSLLWDIPFRKHLPRTCQHLLIALFFCNQYGVSIRILSEVYAAVHAELAKEYGIQRNPKDFEEALKTLEGGFVKISGQKVTYVNPSVRDFMSGYLTDWPLLQCLARASVRCDFAKAVWKHAERMSTIIACRNLEKLAESFKNVAVSMPHLPIKPQTGNTLESYEYSDIHNAQRIALLIAWWFASPNDEFQRAINAISINPIGGWDSWNDGDELVELTGKFRDEDYFAQYVHAAETANLLEDAAVSVISDRYISLEDLDRINDAVDEWKRGLDAKVLDAVRSAVERQFRSAASAFNDIDSESTVDEHAETLQKLGKLVGVDDNLIDRAHYLASDRKNEIASQVEEANEIAVRGPATSPVEVYDEPALRNLFAPLLRQT